MAEPAGPGPAAGEGGALSMADLPDEVRARVVALTADVLPVVPKLPAPLVRVASFAPARRGRLGATTIATALADEAFRERVGVQVVGRSPGPVDPEADPVGAAALTWLTRPEGWPELLASTLERVAERAVAPDVGTGEEERWRDKAQAAERALREARARHREELAEARTENTTLRRKLGDTRAALRAAQAEAEEARAALEAARRDHDAASADRDRELRQLRARVERHEAEAQQVRRTARADRDEVTLRARLLLDTVIDAASGLRRELSLPPVAGAPGDRVEAALAAEAAPATTPALTPTSPAVLEQWLALPRSRLLVDGYNVSKTAWPSSSLETQRTRLVNGLAPLVARTGAETTVVFDAAATSTRPVVGAPRGVKVVFSREGVIADDVIRELVGAEPAGRAVVVVTSDQAVARDVARAGARAVAADALVGLLARSG